jgi:hypothetical protein
MFTCAQPQACPTQQIFFLIALHKRIIWSITSSQLSAQRRTNTSFHLCLRMMHPTHGIFHTFTCAQPQARPTQQIFFSPHYTGESSRVSSQLSAQRRSTQRSSSISDRNHTPNSWALSQVCVLEDVSCSCNHQHLALSIWFKINLHVLSTCL